MYKRVSNFTFGGNVLYLKQIIVVRHAESEEDLNPILNGKLPDEKISVTNAGKQQALRTGEKISRFILTPNSVQFYTSPSRRARRTTEILRHATGDKSDGEILIEQSIRNLDWGDTTPENVKSVERERYAAGVLYYQFPNGDHSPTFVKNIDDFVQRLLASGEESTSPSTVIIVTHGFALRVIAKSLLKLSDGEFKWLKNPQNCYIARFSIADDGKVTISTPLPERDPI